MSLTAQEEFQLWLEAIPSEEHKDTFQSRSTTQELRTTIFSDGSFTDINLKGADSDTPIHCHRFVLAEHSSVFQRMFSSNFTESKTNSIVKIGNIPYHVLNKVVRFLYTGEIEIKGEEALVLLEFGDCYEIVALKKMIEAMLISNIKLVGNIVIPLWIYFKLYNSKEVSNTVKSIITKSFDKIVYSNNLLCQGFLEADVKDVIEILADEDLKIATENDVFDTCISWVLHDINNRQSEMDKLLNQCIRRQMIDQTLIAETINNFGQDILPNEMKSCLFRFMLEQGYDYNLICMKPRNETEIVEALVLTLLPPDIDFGEEGHVCRFTYWKPNSIECCKFSSHVILDGNIVYVPKTFNFETEEHYAIFDGDPHPIYQFPSPSEDTCVEVDIHIEGTRGIIDPSSIILPDKHSIICISQARGTLDLCIASRKTAAAPRLINMPYAVPNPELHVLYKGRVFFFDTKENNVVVFNRKTYQHLRFNIKSRPFTVGLQAAVCSEGNVAVLVDASSIEVIFLDKLLALIDHSLLRRQRRIAHKDEPVSGGDSSERENIDVVKSKPAQKIVNSSTLSTVTGKCSSVKNTLPLPFTNLKQEDRKGHGLIKNELSSNIKTDDGYIKRIRLDNSQNSNMAYSGRNRLCLNRSRSTKSDDVNGEPSTQVVAGDRDAKPLCPLNSGDCCSNSVRPLNSDNVSHRPLNSSDSGNTGSPPPSQCGDVNSETRSKPKKPCRVFKKVFRGPHCNDIQSAIVWGENIYVFSGEQNTEEPYHLKLWSVPLLPLINGKCGDDLQWVVENLPHGDWEYTSFTRGFMSKVQILNPKLNEDSDSDSDS